MADISVVKLITAFIFILSLSSEAAHTRDGKTSSLNKINGNFDYIESNKERPNKSSDADHDLYPSKSSVAPNSRLPFLCRILQKAKFNIFIYSTQDPIRQCFLKLHLSGIFHSKVYSSNSNESSKAMKSVFVTSQSEHKQHFDIANNHTEVKIGKTFLQSNRLPKLTTFLKTSKRPLPKITQTPFLRRTTPGFYQKSTSRPYSSRTSRQIYTSKSTRQYDPWMTTVPPPWITTRQPYPWKTSKIPYSRVTTRQSYPWETTGRSYLWESTRQPYPWETTRQPYPWKTSKIPYSPETTRQPYPWETTGRSYPWESTRQPYPWETTRRPYPWETTRQPYPWKTTRKPYPWEITRQPYPWEITREPYPWEITRQPYPWEITRRPWEIHWTMEPWRPQIRDTSHFEPKYFLIVAGVFVGGSILGVMLRVCILNCDKDGLRRESTDVLLHPPPPQESRTPLTYFAAETVGSTTGGVVNEGLSAADKPPDYFTVANIHGAVANTYTPVISCQADSAPPPYEAVSPE